MKYNKNNTDSINKEDDDRVVANMNIEGMPWHSPGKALYEESSKKQPELSKRELRIFIFSATLGGLLIGAVFVIVFFIFIMFCIHVWF